jgi:repressor LexA
MIPGKVKQTIISSHKQGMTVAEIHKLLRGQNFCLGKTSIYNVLNAAGLQPHRKVPGGSKRRERELTVKERKVLEFIQSATTQKLFSPTLREIQDAIDECSSGNVQALLTRLKNLGYLTWTENKSRTIRIIKDFQEQPADLAAADLAG